MQWFRDDVDSTLTAFFATRRRGCAGRRLASVDRAEQLLRDCFEAVADAVLPHADPRARRGGAPVRRGRCRGQRRAARGAARGAALYVADERWRAAAADERRAQVLAASALLRHLVAVLPPADRAATHPRRRVRDRGRGAAHPGSTPGSPRDAGGAAGPAARRTAARAAGRSAPSPSVVRALGAVQSQDLPGALWAVGRRSGATAAAVMAALDAGEMLRTHVLRPTWHLVAPEDLRPLRRGHGCERQRAAAPMLRRAGLDEAVLRAPARGRSPLACATDPPRAPSSRRRLDAAGVDTVDGVGLANGIIHAESAAVLCSGPARERTADLRARRGPHAARPAPTARGRCSRTSPAATSRPAARRRPPTSAGGPA